MNKEFTQRQTQVTILWKLVSLNRLRHLNNSDQTGGKRQQYSLARNTGRRITYSYDSTGEGEELEADASSCSQCSSAKARTVPGLKRIPSRTRSPWAFLFSSVVLVAPTPTANLKKPPIKTGGRGGAFSNKSNQKHSSDQPTIQGKERITSRSTHRPATRIPE
jgi:hypothetical protein